MISETELIAIQNQINSLLDRGNLTQDDRDYLNVLATLVYDREQKHEPMPVLKGVDLLKALLEESNQKPKDLSFICGDESQVLDVLNGQRQLTENEIQELAAFFKISPRYFRE